MSGQPSEQHFTSIFSSTPTTSGYVTPTSAAFGYYPVTALPESPDNISIHSVMSSLASFHMSSSSSKDEDESEDDDGQGTECTGVIVEWKPGSVWNTYPYQQHAERSLPWEIIGFENDTWLRLRSRKCPIWFQPSQPSVITCSFCNYIPNSVDFRKFMERAVEAPAHTPWPYLNYEQLNLKLHKTTNHNRLLQLKVFSFNLNL